MKTGYGLREWSMLLLLAVIWGSSFILMKRGLEVYSPPQVAALRMFLAFVFLFPFVVTRLKEVKAGQWKYLIASGFLGNGIPALLFTFAQTKLNSSVAGILNSLTPLLTLVVAYVAFRNKIQTIHLIGVLIGLCGAMTILIFKSGGGFEGNYMYGLLLVAACLGYAFSINIIKNYLKELDPIMIAGSAMCAVGPLFGIYLFTSDFTAKLVSGTPALMSFGYVGMLALFGTSISLIFFNRLIKTTSVLFATSVTYLIPVVALLWGFADGEQLGFAQIGGLGAILLGVYLVNRH